VKSKKDKPKSKHVKKVVLRDIPPTYKLIKSSFGLLRSNWKVFLIFTAIYALFMVVLVQGPTKVDIGAIQNTIAESLPDQSDNSTLIAGVLVGESSNISQTGAAYGTFLFLIFSLAVIWLLRATYEGKKIRTRDGFYKGMYGLIPVTLIYALMIIQLLPVAFGGLVYSIVSLNGLAINIVEKSLIWMILGALIFWSLYMLSLTVQAVYIASLPEVTPMQALRQAKKIVKGRRLKVMTRIVAGALVYGIVAFAGLLLAVAILPVAATWWWWAIGLVMLPIAHAYFYSLYRSLM
jgi:hypothetical protein